ncbi:25338_t:CDS:2, partial [Gigaspora rosea]
HSEYERYFESSIMVFNTFIIIYVRRCLSASTFIYGQMSDLMSEFDKLIENNAETQSALLKMRKDLVALQRSQCESCDNLRAQFERIKPTNVTT